MNRELCIARLFTALVIASAMHPLCAGEAHGQDMGPLVEVFNCSGFATSGNATTGNCGVRFPGSNFGTTMQALGASGNSSVPFVSGTTLVLIPTAADHNADNLNYELAAVNVGQFSSTFTFVPNGQNVSFVLSNNTAASAGNATNGDFTGGAGCEGAFFQGFTAGVGPPNNTFAVMLDSYGGNTANSSTFTYSNVQYYVTGAAPPNAPNAPGQSPCNPDSGGGGAGQGWTYVGVNKISTSPVAMNSPANAQNTTTGHTYSATITYDGSNLTINLFDVTAGGSCPGAVNSYANQLLAGESTSQVAMGVTALMTGQTQTVATLTNLVTNPAIIPSFVSFALANKLDVIQVVGEDVGLAFAGNTSFVTNFGGLSLAVFTQSMLALTGINQAFTASQVQFFINLYTANGLPGNATPTAAAIQAAAYGVVFGLNVAQNLEGTGSSAATIQTQVKNALFDIAQTAGGPPGSAYLPGAPLASQPVPFPNCFTYTWTGVNIPAIVGANTAWVGIAGATGLSPPVPLLINTWNFGSPLP